MKTTRTRMLIVFAAAAVVISIFMHWEDVERGFRDGYRSYAAPAASPSGTDSLPG